MGKEIKRKMVTVSKISDLQPIEGADFIEVATIHGWKVVVKKGEFSLNSKILFFEIDSFLPVEERYEFLRKSSYKKYADGSYEGFRLKTIKLKGQLSQGLVLPLELFPELHPDISIDEDVTDLLNVVVFEPPLSACLSGLAKGLFPSHIRKTDQERIQNVTKYFETLKDVKFEASIKLDGSSMTVYYKDGEVGVCSRNLEMKLDSSDSFVRMAKELNLEEKLKNYGKNLALQGELIGTGIQGNNEKIVGNDYYIFDIFDIDNYRYLVPEERHIILDILGLKSVPIVARNYAVFTEHTSLASLLLYAEGSSLNPNSSREGIVFKSEELIKGDILSFKVVSNSFLLSTK